MIRLAALLLLARVSLVGLTLFSRAARALHQAAAERTVQRAVREALK
jgi:hypothetical protein